MTNWVGICERVGLIDWVIVFEGLGILLDLVSEVTWVWLGARRKRISCCCLGCMMYEGEGFSATEWD